MSRTSLLLIRIALALAFLYPAYALWMHSPVWVGYLPSFIYLLGFSKNVILMLIAGVYLVLALWLLSGWRVFLPALLSALLFGAIAYFNRYSLEVLVNYSILCLVAFAVLFKSKYDF